jgi:hypothetical protein
MTRRQVTSRFHFVRVTSVTFLPVLVPAEDDPFQEEVLLDHFLDDLAVGYTAGPPYGERLLTWADLDRLGLSRRALRREAVEHLNANLDRVRIHGQPPALMLSFDGLESTVLLADPFWDSLEQSVPGEVVVGVPARDVVIITGSGSPPGLEKVKRAVERVFFAGDQHLLTRHLLVRRHGAWEVFEPRVPRPRTPTDPPVPTERHARIGRRDEPPPADPSTAFGPPPADRRASGDPDRLAGPVALRPYRRRSLADAFPSRRRP